MPIWGHVELLCRAVAEEGRKEAEKILAQARVEAERILADAQERAQRECEGEILARRSKANAEAKRMIDSAELEAGKRIMAFRERVLRDVFDALAERIKSFSKEPSYSEFLGSAVEEGIDRLLSRELVVELNEEDLEAQRERIAELAEKKALTIEVKPSSSFKGGVRIYTADRRLLYDNSLSARLERSAEDIRQEIWRAIFGTPRETN